jgi:hypothetical protein
VQNIIINQVLLEILFPAAYYTPKSHSGRSTDMAMLSLSLPSLKGFMPWRARTFIDIPPVEIHEIDTAQEKPARALKHLLKLNHANYAVLYNERKFHNHAPHVSYRMTSSPSSYESITDIVQILSSSFLQGADADDLNRVYEAESKLLDPWVDSPGEISTYDWRDYLGRREYVTIL